MRERRVSVDDGEAGARRIPANGCEWRRCEVRGDKWGTPTPLRPMPRDAGGAVGPPR